MINTALITSPQFSPLLKEESAGKEAIQDSFLGVDIASNGVASVSIRSVTMPPPMFGEVD